MPIWVQGTFLLQFIMDNYIRSVHFRISGKPDIVSKNSSLLSTLSDGRSTELSDVTSMMTEAPSTAVTRPIQLTTAAEDMPEARSSPDITFQSMRLNHTATAKTTAPSTITTKVIRPYITPTVEPDLSSTSITERREATTTPPTMYESSSALHTAPTGSSSTRQSTVTAALSNAAIEVIRPEINAATEPGSSSTPINGWRQATTTPLTKFDSPSTPRLTPTEAAVKSGASATSSSRQYTSVVTTSTAFSTTSALSAAEDESVTTEFAPETVIVNGTVEGTK